MNIWGSSNTFKDSLRELFVIFDRVIYFLLDFVYQVFFKVANFELFTNSSIPALFSRIQLLLGIFMVFKLSFSIINGIINPDAFVDKKTGFGNIVVRTITMLFVLLLVIPISIPNAETSFEKDVNNNGILFGTLYNLQERIMYGNTIGRIILGTPVNSTTEDGEELTEEEIQNKQIEEASAELGVSILKTFISISYKDSNELVDNDPTNQENFTCDNNAQIYNAYHNAQVVGDIFNLVSVECSGEYAVNYIPVISGITGGFITFILIGFTVSIAIRSIQLTVLRLVAPIPIVSYIDPKSAKDGAFGSWVKVLSSTYLDLFFRLAIIYFGVYMVHLVIEQIYNTDVGAELIDFLNDPITSMINLFTFIMIVIGIFQFTKMAPKFFKDMFGLKGPGMNNIGLAGMVGGLGGMYASLRAGEGLSVKEAIRSGSAASNMQIQAYNQGKAAPGMGQTFTNSADNMLKTITGNDKMTLGQYGSNMRFAKKNRLMDKHLDDEKNYMYRLEEEYDRAAAMKENASLGRLSMDELDNYSSMFTDMDSKKYGTIDKNSFNKVNSKGESYFDEAAYSQAVAGQMQTYLLDTKTRMNKQKAKVGDIDQERKMRGLDRRFGYNNKYNARRSVNYHPETEKDARADMVYSKGEKHSFSKSYNSLNNVKNIVNRNINNNKK